MELNKANNRTQSKKSHQDNKVQLFLSRTFAFKYLLEFVIGIPYKSLQFLPSETRWPVVIYAHSRDKMCPHTSRHYPQQGNHDARCENDPNETLVLILVILLYLHLTSRRKILHYLAMVWTKDDVDKYVVQVERNCKNAHEVRKACSLAY